MTPDSTKSPKPTQETEVDFINLARTFWDGRIIIGKLILFGILVGFFVAILIPNEFTASSTMVPQISDPKSKLASVSYTHLRAHETRHDLVCRLLLETK